MVSPFLPTNSSNVNLCVYDMQSYRDPGPIGIDGLYMKHSPPHYLNGQAFHNKNYVSGVPAESVY